MASVLLASHLANGVKAMVAKAATSKTTQHSIHIVKALRVPNVAVGHVAHGMISLDDNYTVRDDRI